LITIIVYIAGWYTHSSITSFATLADHTCPSRCVATVNSIILLWPSLETPLMLLRVIPNTRLACERICVAKQIKNF